MTDTIGTDRRRSKVAAAHRHHVARMARGVARRLGCSEVAAQRRLERARLLLREVVAEIEEADCHDLRCWLDAALAEARSAVAGPRVEFSPQHLAYLAQVDGLEDGALARLIANPDCPEALRTWLRKAQAEASSRLDLIAAGSARLASLTC